MNHTCLCLPAKAGTHLPTPEGWKAELALGGWLVTYWNRCPAPGTEPDTVTHLSTNRVRRRLTLLIKANVLTTTPDHQQRLADLTALRSACNAVAEQTSRSGRVDTTDRGVRSCSTATAIRQLTWYFCRNSWSCPNWRPLQHMSLLSYTDDNNTNFLSFSLVITLSNNSYHWSIYQFERSFSHLTKELPHR